MYFTTRVLFLNILNKPLIIIIIIIITKNNLVILTEAILNFGQDLAQRGEKGVDSMVILWFRWRTSSTSVLVFPD